MFIEYISLKDKKNNPQTYRLRKNEKMQNLRTPRIHLWPKTILLEHIPTKK